MESTSVTVVKLDGTSEPFDAGKLRISLKRSGASEDNAEAVVTHIEKELREGITTAEIYKHAFQVLRGFERPVAARYGLKRAVRELGPSGFPFEDFVAELFKARGYKVAVGSMVKGVCAEHELDLRAEKDETVIGAELKFHNNLGLKSDLKIALYVHARFEDLLRAQKQNGITQGWLITNTSFTQNAISYGSCVGLTMVSWAYPEGRSLQDLIESSGVHPITALTSLTQKEKRLLLERRLVLCKDLPKHTDVLESIGVPSRRIELALSESRGLCGA